jgi:hypothetical protein
LDDCQVSEINSTSFAASVYSGHCQGPFCRS